MDAMTRAAPPPGSAQAGDLYVDLQTRTLWLGVDPVVDPSGFVLISDMVKLMADIDAAQIEDRAYTDQQIVTRAPVTHTHTSSQITDFTAAVTAVAAAIPGLNYIRGMILMYSGLLSEVGVGPLAGWSLCDGSNGTPDLREKFVLGAGSRIVGSKNTTEWFYVQGLGTHDHGINYTAITVAQMPAHNHSSITGYMSHDHAHHTAGGTDAQGVHSHGIAEPSDWRAEGNHSWALRPVGSGAQIHSANAGNHGHNFAAWSGGANQNHYHAIPAEGGNQGHNHTTVGGGGAHSDHWVSTAQLREATPFYALAFIMKL